MRVATESGYGLCVTLRNPPDALGRRHIWTTARWRQEGLTSHQIRDLVRSGDLTLIRRGVYATRKSVEWSKTDEVHAHAMLAFATARVIHNAVVSHHSAARIHGFDLYKPTDKEVVTLTLPPGSRGLAKEHEHVIRHRAVVPEADRVTMFGVLVTSPARTVIDIARGSEFMRGVVVADSALHMKKTTDGQLCQMLVACAGWPGREAAGQVVEFADGRSDSVMESCARVIFHRHGLTPPVLQFEVPDTDYRVDFYWPDCKVILETDGLAKYTDDPVRRIARQTRRDNALHDLGYEVIHVTWAELFGDPAKVVARIRRAMSAMRKRRLRGDGGR
jgi:very-short-patch-repair endonuclease